MSELEKSIIESVNNLKHRVEEYKDLSENAESNREYFKGKFQAYSWAHNELLRSIKWTKPELLT